MELNRKQKILKLIIEDYIKYAEPIGSQTLITRYKLPYSSATIRNEMAELEKDGLLEKEHTSSGRKPSTLGYRYYIENLRSKKVDEKFKNEIQSIFDSSKSVEEVIDESCKILSSMTNLTSVVLGPSNNEECLLSIQLIPLTNTSCSAIFVTDKGYVENKTFILNDNVSMDDVKKCLEMLDKRLKGTKVNELVDKLESLKPIFSDYINDYNYLFTSLIKTFYDFQKERNSIYGKDNMLIQPEFKDDANELKKIFDLFSNPDQLYDHLKDMNNNSILDASLLDEGFENMMIISKNIEGNNKSLGKIAIIGPKRMDYENVISALEYTIDEIVKKLGLDDNDDNDDGGNNGRA